MFRCPDDLRFMPVDPHELRKRPGRSRHLPCGRKDLSRMMLLQPCALLDTALVRPHDRFAERFHFAVHQNRVVSRTVKGDGRNPFEINALLSDRRQCAAHGTVPVGRLLFGESGMRVVRPVFHGGFPLKKAVRVDRGDFAAAGAEVYAKQYVLASHHFTQACFGSLLEIRPRLLAPVMVQR